MNAVVYRSDELRARKEKREELPFVETIVGRRGSLRGILSLVEAVCANKYDSSDRGAKPAPARKSSLARFTSSAPAGTEVW